MGAICPECLNVYLFAAIAKMPGYDKELIDHHLDLLLVMQATDQLAKGFNRVTYLDDGFIVEPLGDPS